jgi:hypothetical protein
MTETVLRVSLDELQTVRIVCRQEGCGGVIELPLADMTTRRSGLDCCPVCSAQFARAFPPDEHLFLQIAQAIAKLKNIRSFTLEFPIRVDA